MVTYSIENGIVYSTEPTASGGSATVCIGNEAQYRTVSDSDTQTVYQWQKFNTATGAYEDDTTNTAPIEGVTPTNGQATVAKAAAPVPDPTLEDKVNYLYYKSMGVIS